ncbi:hypothetical protein [Tychonema sp. LEGE 07203]|uniref:hypothetical protein n=1 Tax=Tychonema sp. LEGE 07203 TaxID=1828671 RepID=UPI00187ED52A|nr:hypothetical protein [Tychonema sp. LEGE 07203]MBE9095988.1 hypothetical protein [Tychonema sp. LEGE 07203]
MNSFFRPLLWAIPYREATIHLPLTKEPIRQRLATIIPANVIGVTPTLVGGQLPYRYKIYLDGYSLRAIGPSGNRRWCLVTQGEIQDIPGGSVLRLTLRLSTLIIVQLLLSLALLIWFFRIFFIENSLPIILFFTMQFLFIMAFNFKYEADCTLEILRQLIADCQLVDSSSSID